MQFLLIDLALVFLALLGYRALSLAARYRAAVVILEHRAWAYPRIGRHSEIAPPKPASAKPARREAMTPKPVPCGDRCRATLHRLINFW